MTAYSGREAIPRDVKGTRGYSGRLVYMRTGLVKTFFEILFLLL